MTEYRNANKNEKKKILIVCIRYFIKIILLSLGIAFSSWRSRRKEKYISIIILESPIKRWTIIFQMIKIWIKAQLT